jgi:hypothetical protein
MFRKTQMVIVAALTLATAACAKPPQAQIDAVNAALTNATGAGASEYAPESYSAARDAQAKLDAELKAQEGKFALTRSYTEATKLATAAAEAGEKAATEAAQRKQAAQTEASTLVADARTAIEGAETALTSAPKGKGSQADLDALQSDLTAAKSALGEAETALTGQHYLDVKAKAAASKEKATAVKSAVEQAIQTRQGARRRG